MRVINDSINRITQHYDNKGHRGVDLGWRSDENQNRVYSNCKGVVYEIQTGITTLRGSTGTKSWGNYVLIKHPNGMFSRYAHLREVYVSVDQEVDENTCVGLIGESGNVTARHLHFEVSKSYSSSTRINPEPYLEKAIYSGNKSKYCAYDNVKNKWLPEVQVGTNAYAGNLGNGVSGFKLENATYRVHDKKKGYWLPWVDGYNGYAGNLPNDIDAVQIKNRTYRAYDNKKKKWLPWVNGTNGYAGNMNNSVGGIQVK